MGKYLSNNQICASYSDLFLTKLGSDFHFHMWDFPHNTQRHFLEELSGTHASTILICRFVNFVQSIKKSSKCAVYVPKSKEHIQVVVKTTGSENIEDVKVNEIKKTMYVFDRKQ